MDVALIAGVRGQEYVTQLENIYLTLQRVPSNALGIESYVYATGEEIMGVILIVGGTLSG